MWPTANPYLNLLFVTFIALFILVLLWLGLIYHPTNWRGYTDIGKGYENAMRKADDEAKGKESAIEQSLWKTRPSSTLGNGLPHRTELIHDHIAPRSPESSRLQRLPDEFIISQPTSAASGALEVMKIVRIPQEIRGGWQLAMPNGVCIGRQGHIRLCSHKTLTYDDIKGRIDGGQHGEDRIFLGSCDHEDHSRPCVEGQGPQAFATKLPGGMTVILIFWRGHSGGDPSVFHPSGYLYKTKLKDAVQNIRLQGGRHMTPQRGLNAMAEWDSIMEIDGSESISPDLIKLRGGWASEDPGRPHACSPFRTLKVACGHYTKLVEQLFLDLPISEVLHPTEGTPVFEPWASSYVKSIRESRFGDAIWARYQMLGQVVDGLCRGKTILERITEDAMGYKKYSSEFYAEAVAFYRANNSSSDGHPEVIEIILRVDTEDLTGKHIPEDG
ncbi:hypothetical protein LB506_005736 [Fusarium annulatum]|nr:hypothetical protein LB506_005736 [Fusarium annulatum]